MHIDIHANERMYIPVLHACVQAAGLPPAAPPRGWLAEQQRGAAPAGGGEDAGGGDGAAGAGWHVLMSQLSMHTVLGILACYSVGEQACCKHS